MTMAIYINLKSRVFSFDTFSAVYYPQDSVQCGDEWGEVLGDFG